MNAAPSKPKAKKNRRDAWTKPLADLLAQPRASESIWTKPLADVIKDGGGRT